VRLQVGGVVDDDDGGSHFRVVALYLLLFDTIIPFFNKSFRIDMMYSFCVVKSSEFFFV
jgi:hypothetical protein